MTAKIIMVFKHEDARLRHCPPIEPGRRQPTDAATDYDEIVVFLDWRAIDRKCPALQRQRMRYLERTCVMTAQTGERGRIVHWLRGDLRLRR